MNALLLPRDVRPCLAVILPDPSSCRLLPDRTVGGVEGDGDFPETAGREGKHLPRRAERTEGDPLQIRHAGGEHR